MEINTPTIFNQSTLGNIFGNTLEWYDFVLYGSLAPFIAHHFFPEKNSLISLMLTFAVFAVGFLMRPLGGMIFGYFGDTRGRRKPLLWSIALMVIPTILIGFVPSYSTIGFLAPLIIILIRLFQGLAVGGEFAGSMVYLTELSDQKNRAFFGSFASFGIFTGLLLGPIVILLTNHSMTHNQFSEWGWRVPFLFSFILGIIVYFWRRNMHESTAYIQDVKKKLITHSPIKECFRSHKAALLISACVSAQVGIPFWLVMVYSITYFTKILHAPFSIVETQNMYAILISLIAIPFFGWLTKKISTWLLLIIISFSFIVFSYVIDIVLIHHVISEKFYMADFAITILVAAYLATFEGFLASLFPTEIRYSSIAISYNISLAIFGGTAPLIVTAMIKNGIVTAPGIVLTIGGVIAFVALLFARRFARY
ncbi:MAG: hypothetical protein A3C44_02530 [Gammaproteobacteria bacterium RIFCSPHIGHO2_02_FULL_39_13]|nr:MAG: hypothetical protein A3C44_02530 [Gammaproteobacteria bacterium RIFCSPHIGHO2_02_FULL_39_13]OGT50145.1 MAG: hypothetical protein A3E53_01835 [Gammaproteobacteria bacterium RIFCSPHIGHO2_12_FULL_39_24]